MAIANDGVVYTRAWVVRLVLDIAGYVADADLTQGTIVEPSCGRGAFLREIVARLCTSAESRNALCAERLRHAVCAYDTDEASVNASNDLVRQVLCEHGMSAGDANALADAWVHQGDYLLADDLPKARWVVGNPPYVRATHISRDLRSAYAEHLSCFSMGTDLYVGFYEKSLEILENGGALCFICADRWLQNAYGRKLRGLVSRDFHLSALIRMHAADAFEEGVSAYPAITLIKNEGGESLKFVDCHRDFSDADAKGVGVWVAATESDDLTTGSFDAVTLPLPKGDSIIPLSSPKNIRRLQALSERLPSMDEAGVHIGIGVATGCDRVFITEDPTIVEGSRLLPLFYMRDWRSGRRDRKKWLVNPWDCDGRLVNLRDYPELSAYFKSHEGRLRRRYVARQHPESWYRTLDKLNSSLINTPKLLVPDLSNSCDPVLDTGQLYPHHNCYWITSDEWALDELGGLLMSDVVEGFIDALGVKMNGGTKRFQAQYLRLVHIPRSDDVSPAVRRELAEAFRANDRAGASRAAAIAFGIDGDSNKSEQS